MGNLTVGAFNCSTCIWRAVKFPTYGASFSVKMVKCPPFPLHSPGGDSGTYIDRCINVSSHLKEELAWAVDKRLWVISTIMLFKNGNNIKELKGTKNKAVLNLKQYCLRCYMALSNVF